jgi:hypothetical protein
MFNLFHKFCCHLSFIGFEGPRRTNKQVDVLSTGGALAQQSSTSINAPLEEEEHPRCQSATS